MAQTKIIRLVATNDRGIRIGQYHQNAKQPDAVVDQVRELHEDQGWSYRRIAVLLKLSKSVVAGWCRYERRADCYQNWKKIEVKEK